MKNNTILRLRDRRFSKRTSSALLPTALVAAGVGLFAAMPAAQAQTVVYDNTVNFSGFSYSNGGATAASKITTLVADDITLSTPLATTISAFAFSVSDSLTTNITARPRVRFYMSDGANGGPGTYITGFSFNPITFTPGVGTFNATLAAASQFVIPASTSSTASFWAGITFDNVGATSTTVAQLNALGQGLFDPPVVGTSTDTAFQTTAGGSFLVNNPAGSQFNFGNSTNPANPVANFGWQFTGTPIAAATPAPSSLLVSLLGVPGIGLLLRRRAAKKRG